MGWGLTICFWLGPPWFNYWFSFTLLHSRISHSHSRISHQYSSLFIILMNLIFMFSLWCIDWVGSLYANRILCFSILRVTSGPRLKWASCKSALNPRWFILLAVLRRWSRCWSYSLLLCGLFYEAICFMSCLVLFCSCVFQSFYQCDYIAWGRDS